MKNFYLIIAIFLFIPELQSQKISGDYDSTSFIEVIEKIESNSRYRFFFRDQWVENLFVTVSFSESTIPDMLDMVLENTPLTYFLYGNRIILANNTNILTDLPIKGALKQKPVQNQIETGLVFAREYQAEDADDEAERVYEIGNRNKYERGGEVTVAGFVLEKTTGESVEGAFIYIETPFLGTSSGPDGFYSLTIPNGKQTIQIQSVNMKNTQRNLILLSDGKLDIHLNEDVIALNSVTVSADRELNVKSTQMGLTRIDVEEAKVVPVVLGELDLIKIATTTSGVQTVGEGSAGINIRGGKADQNLFLLDGTPIYNTSHFFGFFSVINSDVIEGLEIYKSGIPAAYGGRLSSVFDITSKKPTTEKISGKGGIGPVTSRMMLEGSLFDNRTNFVVGGRGTYSNWVLDNIENSSIGNNRATFYDYILKVSQQIGDKDEVSVSGYYSFDSFRLSSDTLLSFTDFTYDNELLTLNWKHIFNNKIEGTLSTGISNYNYNVGYTQLASQAFNVDFGVREIHGRLNFDYFQNEKLSYKGGIQVKHHGINPGEKSPAGSASLITPAKVEDEKGAEWAPYISAAFDTGNKLSLYAGIRYSIFNVLGPRTEYVYDNGEGKSALTRSDSITYENGEVIETYHGAELRLSSRYSLNESTSLKASYNRTRQNVHLLLNAASVAPTDIWRLSSAHIRPQIADQYSVGVYKNFYSKHVIETSAEVYFKDIDNLLDFKVGADLQFNQAIETDVLQGKGRSYGLELSIKKSSGWLTGWVNYTYSRSLIQLDGRIPSEVINGGSFFPTGYDKPHYINSVTNYKFTRRYSMSLNVVYASGVPVTYPVGKWKFRNVENLYYSDRNQFRIPDYFRIDLGLNVEGSHKIKKLAHSFWTFSVYNVLGRDNIYSVFFTVEEGEVSGFKLTVFSNPVPTITYNFSF